MNTEPQIPEHQTNLLTEKYRATRLEDLIGLEQICKQAQDWFADYEDTHKKTHTNTITNTNTITKIQKKVLLFTGAPSTGKTTLAYILMKMHDYVIKEFNASDVRGRKQMNLALETLFTNKIISLQNTQNTQNNTQNNGNLCSKKVGLIIDEIDGMTGGEKGGLHEFTTLINSCSYKNIPPIICICNNSGNTKLKMLRNMCLELHFALPKKENLVKFIKNICEKEHENLQLDDEQISKIIELSQCDYRRVLTFLQFGHPDEGTDLNSSRSGSLKTLDYDKTTALQKLFISREKFTEIFRLYNMYKEQLSVFDKYLDYLCTRKTGTNNVLDTALDAVLDTVLENMEKTIKSIGIGDMLVNSHNRELLCIANAYMPNRFLGVRKSIQPPFEVPFGDFKM